LRSKWCSKVQGFGCFWVFDGPSFPVVPALQVALRLQGEESVKRHGEGKCEQQRRCPRTRKALETCKYGLRNKMKDLLESLEPEIVIPERFQGTRKRGFA
jgi:hypothetical protein